MQVIIGKPLPPELEQALTILIESQQDPPKVDPPNQSPGHLIKCSSNSPVQNSSESLNLSPIGKRDSSPIAGGDGESQLNTPDRSSAHQQTIIDDSNLTHLAFSSPAPTTSQIESTSSNATSSFWVDSQYTRINTSYALTSIHSDDIFSIFSQEKSSISEFEDSPPSKQSSLKIGNVPVYLFRGSSSDGKEIFYIIPTDSLAKDELSHKSFVSKMMAYC